MVLAYLVTKDPTESEEDGTNEIEDSILKIVNVDCCLDKNGKAHETSRYEIMNRADDPHLVIRRGQPFVLKLTLSRSYDEEIDEISIVLSPDGVQPTLQNSGKPKIKTYSDDSLEIEVTTLPKAEIGKWNIIVVTKVKGSDNVTKFTVDRPFYLLFNPWCKEDVVYLENESEREEYVLNESGIMGQSNRQQKILRNWCYAQFDDNILDCALYLITEVSEVSLSKRNDPISVTQGLSKAVRGYEGDRGVLEGNWEDVIHGGTPPTQWMGSRKILLDYFKTKKTIKYGQCWVFAGLLNTICRTLGLPCRAATNYDSVQDDDHSLTLDIYVDEHFNTIKWEKNWNYHVWNEVWMKRIDLDPHYNGWQVIDGTYGIGPASVMAIKEGEIQKSHGTADIFSEVNAEIVHWLYRGENKEPLFIHKRRWGQNVITKAVGRDEFEDITHTYKYPEGSNEADAAMKLAMSYNDSTLSRKFLKGTSKKDIELNFVPNDDIPIGQPFSVVLTMKNVNEKQEFTISFKLQVETIMYTGRVVQKVKQFSGKKLIKPNTVDQVQFEVSWEEYRNLQPDQYIFRMSCYATVEGTETPYIEWDDFCFLKPHIAIELKNELAVGEELQATAHFKNPLPIPLTSGKFFIELTGFDKTSELDWDLEEDVEAGGKAKCKFSITPKSKGEATIAVKFYSNELKDVNGFRKVVVNF